MTQRRSALFLVPLAAGLGWSAGVPSVNLAPFFLFPVLWFLSPSRLIAAFTAAAFYLSASYGIVASAPVYFELGAGLQTLCYLLFFWGGTALTLTLPWTFFWSRPASPFPSKCLRLTVIFILLSVPPLGLWGWGNALLCAGYLLPCTREAGVVCLILAWAGLWHCAENRRAAFFALLVPMACYAAFMSPSSRLDARIPPDWEGIYTSFGKLYSGSDDSVSPYWRYQILSIILKNSKAKYVVFPETVAGWWGMTTELLWAEETKAFETQGRTFFVGAETTKKGTKKYYNVVQVRGGNHGTVVQRYPVPYSMWNPWRETGAVAEWFGGSGIVAADGLSVGVLVCYEPYLYLPCLQTMIRRPDVLVVVSNSWWSRTTNLPLISDKCAKSWALLYDVPLVLSKNI